MPENKTKPNKASVAEFMNAVEDKTKRDDTKAIVRMMREITRKRATMWGDALIGFGKYAYKYRSGHSGEFPLVAVSPRKRNISVYIMPGFGDYDALMSKLGKYKTGKSCLYINKLDDVDNDVLYKLIEKTVAYMKEKYDVK